MRVPPRPAVRRVRRRPLAVTGIVLAVLLFLLGGYFTFQTELLWFQETGFEDVFWTGIWVRLGLAAAFGLTFAVALLVNLWIVRKVTNPARLFSVADEVLERYRATLQPYTKWVVIGSAVLFGLFAGSGAGIQWREWLLFQNGVDFGGEPDPVFGKDLGFYVFRLPFHQFLFTWGFSSLVVVTLITAGAHYFMGGIRPQARGDRVAPEVRAHLSVLLGLMVLLKAWGYRLDQFNLLSSSRGTVTGASYTDINAELPALRLLVVIAIVCAAFFFLNARMKNWILPIGGIGLLALMSIVAGGIYPAAIQRLRVTPNEQLREAPFITRNIEATRRAFQIDKVEEKPFEATADLDAKQVGRNRATVQNIRLWEPSVLSRSYLQLQRIKQYYEFLDVDVDRYDFGGERRQVMLSAREMDQRELDQSARTWVNEHLVYTHGYGVVASRVDRVTGEGQPSFIVRNIPPVSVAGAPTVTQPRIYFGEVEQTRFVVVNTEQEELDYPQGEAGDRFAGTRYQGKGGIKLGGIFRRAAFAWRFRDMNLLISGTLTGDSKIMFRRAIFDRVQQVAPFLQLDDDPYIAVIDGRLQWIIDAYTTTDRYPYSQRIDLADASDGSIRGQGNYIRNAVKFVVDAEHGTIDAYLWDEDDPIIKAWAKAFPGIFKPRSAMSASLLAHVRYPEGLFAVQTDRFSTYHIDDANNFYSKEDAWRVANDPTITGLQTPRVPPYYVLMKLPGEKRLDFVLVRPFTPNRRQNLTAYMVAHGDPDKYGKLVAYVFPKRDVIFGPEQIQARINGDTTISPEITLLTQGGSRVIYGNILIVPIEQSLLYVQPLYVQGSGSNLPELKRVVAVSGEKVKMRNTLEEALDAIFGEEATPGTGVEPRPEEDVAALIAQAIEHDQRAQAALRRGDFAAYGREQTRMRQSLDRAAQRSGAAPSPSPSPSPS